MKVISSYNPKSLIKWLFPSALSMLASVCPGQDHQSTRKSSRTPVETIKRAHQSTESSRPANAAHMAALSFRDAARVATLATVKIKLRFDYTPIPLPDFYFEFFDQKFVGPYLPETQKDPTGSASGVLISSDGYVVTNYHVVNGADKIQIALNDGLDYEASVVGTDKAADLALLKINGNDLPFIEFGNSDSAAVGDIVLIVGNPLAFTSTVTQGIISYKARNIAQSTERWTLQSYIQTDGVVNIGNSGGALVDLSGRLIGIVTAIASPNGVYAGYSFAIPVQVVKKTADDLRRYGYVRRGSFGIKVSEISPEKAKKLNIPFSVGIFIDSIDTGGAADIGGLRTGDIITRIDGRRMDSRAQLSEFVACSYPGQKVRITFFRNGKQQEIPITLQDGKL
ncbi:S1C family serine protease [Dyadobacter sp. BHUBP1]|uniref:S1C family serine protease n=1 Tax=Dyadobacter sp. BHUBP1 TaxID=3424178 RepID=UPI003D345286